MAMKEGFIEKLSEMIKSDSEETRFNAIRELASKNDEELIPMLVHTLSDQSYRIREEAIKSLCSYSPKLLFPRLEAFLRDDERADLRNAAITIFPRFGERSIGKLSELVKDNDEEVRLFTTQILGDISEGKSVDLLLESMNDPDINVRHAAAESLGKIRDPRAIPALVKALNDEFWVQYSAVNALGNIGNPAGAAALVEKLDDEMLRQPIVQALGKIGDPSCVPILVSMLTLKDSAVRNDLIAALVKIQSKSLSPSDLGGEYLPKIKKSLSESEMTEHLLASLDDPDIEIKRNAVIALGWLKERRAIKRLLDFLNNWELEEYVTGSIVSIGSNAVEELTECLSNADPSLRVSIIRCLGWIDDKRGVLACIPYLKDDDKDVVRQALVTMTSSLESSEVEDALVSMIPPQDADIRDELVEILGKSGSKSLVLRLLDILKGENHDSKKIALRILGRIKPKDIVSELIVFLNDPNDEIRAQAFKTLCYISPESIDSGMISKGIAEKSPTVRKALALALAAKGMVKAEDSLILLLKDMDPEVRIMAVRTLADIGTKKSAQSLIEIFPQSDKRVKSEIIQTLGKTFSRQDDRECLDFLTELLKNADNDVKRIAIKALGETKDSRCVPELILCLDDSDWSLRSETVRALGKIEDKKSVKYIIKCLKDKEDIVKKEAVWALGQMRAQKAASLVLPLIHNENLMLEVIEALGKIDVSSEPAFYEFLKRSNTKIKCHLIDLLGRLKNKASLKYLFDILGDDFFLVRQHAAKALGDLGDKSAIKVLHKAQKEDPSEEVRKEATSSLKKLNTAL